MKAIKGLEVNMELTRKITEAATEAIRAGMTKEEVSAVLARIQEILDNSDD